VIREVGVPTEELRDPWDAPERHPGNRNQEEEARDDAQEGLEAHHREEARKVYFLVFKSQLDIGYQLHEKHAEASTVDAMKAANPMTPVRRHTATKAQRDVLGSVVHWHLSHLLLTRRAKTRAVTCNLLAADSAWATSLSTSAAQLSASKMSEQCTRIRSSPWLNAPKF
jgi:hypothetical protein